MGKKVVVFDLRKDMTFAKDIEDKLDFVQGDLTDFPKIIHTIRHYKIGRIIHKASAPLMMRKGGGNIVNIASMLGLVGAPGRVAYGPAKAGVIHFTKILALEWPDKNVRVNAVAPGYVETERLLGHITSQKYIDIETIKKRTPIGRFATTTDISKAVQFLIFEDASFITGHTLVVDGGWTAYGYL